MKWAPWLLLLAIVHDLTAGPAIAVSAQPDSPTVAARPGPPAVDRSRQMPPGWTVQNWGASWCGGCRTWKASEAPELQRDGVLQSFDYDDPELKTAVRQLQAAGKLGTLPACFVVDENNLIRGSYGYASAKRLKAEAWRLFDAIHGQPPAPKATSMILQRPARRRLPREYFPGYGSIDLETYNGCGARSCGMCNTILARKADLLRQYTAEADAAWQQMQQQQRTLKAPQPPPVQIKLPMETEPEADAEPETEPAAGQAPMAPELVAEVLPALNLYPGAVLLDVGSGDGRLLIGAAAYGATGVGVEIDPDQVAQSRQRVAEVGMADRITIHQVDAKTINPADYGATHVVAYLGPETLADVAHVFTAEGVERSISVCHPVDGVDMTKTGSLFVWMRAANRGVVWGLQ
jgi:hypothetical protein